jgi:tRNA (adenine57-N1/adenine58-N1)-methyltransferase
MKVLISKKTGIYYYFNENTNADFHTKEGFIKLDELLSNKKRVFTDNTQIEFIKFDANLNDMKKKFKRGPQIITPKDLGYIIARTGINRNSFIVEAGGGSGAGTSFFASIAKKVHTYEIREDFCKIVEKNLKFANIDNVELFCGNLADFVEKEKDGIDMLFLDMPNPREILEKDLSKVKLGNYIVCYVPSITQVIDVAELVYGRDDLYLEEVSETNLRYWKVKERVVRPEFKKDVDHSAFLIFIRKV